MASLLKDPIVLVCAAILIFGFIALLWGLARLTQKKPNVGRDLLLEDLPADNLTPPVDDNLFRDPLATPAVPAVPPAPAREEVVRSTNASNVPTQVSDRLEQMAQRLAEMQSVLNKQASAPSGTGGGGTLGQGFSPETVDKLLKMIGNVSQQVDLLQKALNSPATSVSKTDS